MSSLSTDQIFLLGCIAEGEIENLQGYLDAFPPPHSINYEDKEVESASLTPLVTSIFCKQNAITDLLMAKGAKPCHITAVGTNALSTALRVKDDKMVERLRPLFQKQVWGGGEDRLLVEQVQALMDDYYPASRVKTNPNIRSYRAMLVPKLQRYRTQITPLPQPDKEYLGKEKAEFEVMLKEREHYDRRFKMLASQIPDQKEREAFIKAEVDARRKELREKSEAEREKQALAQKAAELEKRAQALQAELEAARREQKAHSERVEQVGEKHEQLAQRVEIVEKKVERLWDEHEKEAEIKAQQQQIRRDEPLRTFYQGIKRLINTFFMGRQVAKSGEVSVTGPSTMVKDAFSMAGDAIPIPMAGVVLKVVGQLAFLYQKHKKNQRDKRVDGGLTALASDSTELNDEIVEPASRRLTLMGATQLRRFGTPQVATLAECAVRLMLVYIVYELPDNPQIAYGDVIQQLLLAVRVKGLAGLKIKDVNGKSLKPKSLVTLKGETVSESDVFAAFFEVKESVPRPVMATPVKAPPKSPPRPQSPVPGLLEIKPQVQPLKAAALVPPTAQVSPSLVLQSTAQKQQQPKSIRTSSELVMVT